MVSKNPLVLKIAEGTPSDELLKYLLSKQLAFTEEEYLESLVFVLPDLRFQERAREMLGLIPQPVKEQYVQKKDAHAAGGRFHPAGSAGRRLFQHPDPDHPEPEVSRPNSCCASPPRPRRPSWKSCWKTRSS